MGYDETSFTLSQEQQSVNICVTATSPGIKTDFSINITTATNASSEIYSNGWFPCIHVIWVYSLPADSTDIHQSAISLEFVVNATHLSMTQCYTFSVDFDSEEICEYYTKCEDARFRSHLLKANESDYVTIERSSVEIVAKLPHKCNICSTSTPTPTAISDNSPTSSAGLSDGVIAAVVVSVVVAIIIVVCAAILVVVLFYCNKTRKRHISSL